MRNVLLFCMLLGIVPLEAGKAAFSITLKGAPVGYEVVEDLPAKRGFRVADTFHIRVNMLGAAKEMRTVLIAHTDTRFAVEGFVFTMQTTDQNVRMEGQVSGDTLVVKIRTPTGSLLPRRFPLHGKRVVLPALLVPMIERGLVPQRESVQVFDPSVLNLSPGVIRRKGNRVMLAHTAGKTVYEVRDGRVVAFSGDLDLRAERRPRAQVGLPEKLVNLLERYAIRPEGSAFKIGRAHRLVLRLYPVTDDVVLDFGPQRLLRRSGDTAWVEIRFRDPWRPEGRDPVKDLTPYLADDPYLQPSDPVVQDLARQITEGLTDTVAMAEALLRWVFDRLAKVPSVTIPTATEVLQSMQGDCNEHATLFGGMARALGIPTEVIVGLVYQNGAYYYHAWDALYLRGQWVWVDPVMGEFPARTNHLMLQRGSLEKQSLIMPLVGKLRIVVE